MTNASASAPGAPPAMSDPQTGQVLMTHDVGLHARPSVRLTQLAKRFAARIEFGLSADGPWIDAKSVARVMATKAPKDTVLFFRAEGEDAGAAVAALTALVARDFSDDSAA